MLCLTHRYYDPATGRFVNRDPTGYDGGINLYTFAGGNPVNGRDPLGTDWTIGPGGAPWLVFTSEGTSLGFKTGGTAIAHSFSFGWYDDAGYREMPGYSQSLFCADISRECLIDASGGALNAAATAGKFGSASKGISTATWWWKGMSSDITWFKSPIYYELGQKTTKEFEQFASIGNPVERGEAIWQKMKWKSLFVETDIKSWAATFPEGPTPGARWLARGFNLFDIFQNPQNGVKPLPVRAAQRANSIGSWYWHSVGGKP